MTHTGFRAESCSCNCRPFSGSSCGLTNLPTPHSEHNSTPQPTRSAVSAQRSMSHYYRMPPASPVAQDPYAGVVHSTPSSSAVAARRLPSLTMDLDSTPKPMSSRTQYNSPRTVALSTRPLDVAACSAPMDARARSTSSQGTSSKNSSVDLERVPARPKRKRITPEQLEVLLSLFAETDTPSYELRETVGAQLKMSNREVQVSLAGGSGLAVLRRSSWWAFLFGRR